MENEVVKKPSSSTEAAQADDKMDFEQRARAMMLSESRGIDDETAHELVYLRDRKIELEKQLTIITTELATARVVGAQGVTGINLIAQERQRQMNVEGWTPEHDASHDRGQMAIAAACYAVEDTDASVSCPDDDPEGNGWPWDRNWWKPKDTIRNLARAGALIAAEIDREIGTGNAASTSLDSADGES